MRTKITWTNSKDRELSEYLDDLNWGKYNDFSIKVSQKIEQISKAGYDFNEVTIIGEFYLCYNESKNGKRICLDCKLSTRHFDYYIGERSSIVEHQDLTSDFHFNNIFFTKRRNEIGEILKNKMRVCEYGYSAFNRKY